MVRLEARIDAAESPQALHQQRRADEHRQGGRNLADDDNIEHGRTMTPTAWARAGFHVRERGPSRHQQRNDADEQQRERGGGKRDDDRSRVDASVDADVARLGGDQQVRRDRRQCQRRGPADRHEHHGLDQGLPREMRASRTERQPDRTLALARRGAYGEQTGDVRAREHQRQKRQRRNRGECTADLGTDRPSACSGHQDDLARVRRAAPRQRGVARRDR